MKIRTWVPVLDLRITTHNGVETDQRLIWCDLFVTITLWSSLKSLTNLNPTLFQPENLLPHRNHTLADAIVPKNLLTSAVRDYNVMTDHCTALCLYNLQVYTNVCAETAFLLISALILISPLPYLLPLREVVKQPWGVTSPINELVCEPLWESIHSQPVLMQPVGCNDVKRWNRTDINTNSSRQAQAGANTRLKNGPIEQRSTFEWKFFTSKKYFGS